ncbi:MAG: hypothetical protein FJ098_09325, partial [Deltaproteobacteria bacterium]|nr:hypothetical protein [Deltaproteobacteria bacterium]
FYFLETSRLGLDARLALDLLPDPGLGLRWEVMTPDRVTVLRGTTEPGQRGQVPNLAVLPGAEGIFVVVRGPETLEGLAGYTVTATVNALEGRTELEPDDSPETAVRVEVPATVTGWLHAPGDRDLFLVSPGEAAAVRVDLDGLPGVRPALEILDAEGETVSRIEAPAPGEGLSLPNWRPTPGAALLAVVAQEGAAPMVPYSLAIQPRDTEGEETEPNDTPADGTAVAPGEEGIQAWISLPGDRDCFLLPAVEPGGTLSISLVEAGDRSIRGTVFGPGGEPLDQVTVDAGTSGRLRVQPEAPDGMVLCVEAVDATPSASRNGYRVACLPHRPEPLEDGR